MSVPRLEGIAERRITMLIVKHGPLGTDHPLLRGPVARCAACAAFLQSGDYVALVPVGPGTDETARAACRDDRPYSPVALPVHWSCATGE